jgi:hypothetical protein
VKGSPQVEQAELLLLRTLDALLCLSALMVPAIALHSCCCSSCWRGYRAVRRGDRLPVLGRPNNMVTKLALDYFTKSWKPRDINQRVDSSIN